MKPTERPPAPEMPDPGLPTLSTVIASNLKRRRQELNWNQGDLAEAMAQMQWTPTTVTWVETGRRQIRADELFRLCHVLGVTPGYFTEGQGYYYLREGAPMMPLAGLQTALVEPLKPQRLDTSGQVVRDEERKAAARVGIEVAFFRMQARDLWHGLTLIEERERRLGGPGGKSARSIQAKRGRITRELINEFLSSYEVLSPVSVREKHPDVSTDENPPNKNGEADD